MNPSIKYVFDAAASDYDRQRRQLIPCFDDFYGIAVSLVECTGSSPRILDLGAGTGLFSSFVLQKYSDAQLTLVDLSDKMLEGARVRFKPIDSVQYITADYTSYESTEPYDAVISSLSIHHLTHEDKQRLFHTIHRLLRPGGVFVNADQVQGHTSVSDAYYRMRWLEAIEQAGLSQEDITAAIERRKVDINASVPDQIAWLEQAGFHDVDCMYKYFDFGVFFGRKA